MKKIFKLGITFLTSIAMLCGCSIEFVEDTTSTQDTTTQIEPIENIQDTELTEEITSIEKEIEETQDETISENTEISAYKTYTFRNDTLYEQHYQKHGIEMGFSTSEEYLQGANDVINNPNSLHKLEAEDGDDVYYLEDTQEFVVVSTDGYIRTYYYASLDYFNRQ